MTLFARVHSPCPYKGKFSHIMKGTECQMCKRPIADLSAMKPAERDRFLSACDTELCVSSRVGIRSVLGAMAMSGFAMASVFEA